jgi:toxin ParE1/3/4
MLQIDVSIDAEEDIDQISAYTTRTWGWRQASRYLAKLEDGCNLLVQNPSIGRTCDSIRPGLRRFEIGKHVVFYILIPDGIQIARILHQQMIPAKAHFEQ